MAGANSTKSIFLALGANFAIAVAKGVAAFITSSDLCLRRQSTRWPTAATKGCSSMGSSTQKKPQAPTTHWDTDEPSISGHSS